MTTRVHAVRAASRGDVPALAELHAASWRRTYRGVFRDAFLDGPVVEDRRRVWTDRMENPDARQLVLVGTVEGAVQGLVCAYAEADVGWGVFIDNLHVAAPSQGTGLGSALLRAAAEWACRQRPHLPPYLWVLAPNLAAQRFYEARGATRREAVVRENPGGGTATYLRHVWTDPAQMAARCGERR